MTLYKIAKITEQPTNTITRWAVREVQISGQKSLHLVGYLPEEYASRVSTKIITFDKEKMLIETENGRIYYLLGQPGTHRNEDYAWDTWSLCKAAKEEIDVTNQFRGGSSLSEC